ncbi:AsmA family protein [Methylobacterium thuringiense]|nr:AsmA family protein [Methylobacterium thuringiense]
MTPRRTLTTFGPAVALFAMISGLVCGCVPWSVDVPSAAAFVGRGLAESYGIVLTPRGRTEISLLPLPRIGFSDIRLSAGTADGPVLSEGGSLTVQLSLASLLLGRAEVVSLSLDGAHVALPASDDDTRWAGPLKRISETLSGGDVSHPRRLTLSHATVTGRDPRDGRPETARDVDLALSWPLWSDKAAIAGGLTWNGASARFTLTSLCPADLLAGRETPFTAALTWPAGSLDADGVGSLANGLTLAGQGSLKTRSLPETLAWTGDDIGLSPLMESFSVEGSFEASRDGLRLPSMRVSAGSTVLEGAGSAEMTGRRPSIRATLDAQEINLAPVLAGLLRVAGLDGDDGWGRHPLALGPLTGGDLDLRLSGGSARLGPIVLEDLASSVIVRAGGIDVTLGRASLRGGTLKGRAALRSPAGSAADETEVKAQGVFDGLDLGTLLVDLGESSWMLGTTQGSFSIEGRGRDAAGLVQTFAGRAVLAVDGGAIAGLDLADVIHRGGAVAQGALARRNGRTAFERAGITLAFSDGIGEIEEGGLTARSLTARLRGRISLPERSFLARAALLPRKGATDSGSLAVPTAFEIAGPWNAVAVRAGSRSDAADPADAVARAPSAIVPGLPTQVRAYAP